MLAQLTTALQFSAIYALFALSTYVALSAGVLSLGSAAFGAIAGFASVVLITDFGVPLVVAIAAGAIIGGGVGLLVALPILRLGSHYLAMATLAVLLVTRVVILNLPDVTGGAAGITVPKLVTPWHLIGSLAIFAWLFARLRGSRLGLAIESVREDAQVAASLGIDTIKIQRFAMTLSGVLGGVAGVLLSNQLRYIGPDTFYVGIAFIMLASVVLGGAYSWLGPIVGAVVFTLVPEVLQEFLEHGEQIANGAILVVIMLYLPRGIIDPVRWRRGRSGDDPPGPSKPMSVATEVRSEDA